MRTRTSPMVLLLAILIIWQVLIQIPHALHPNHDSWGLTDWLINYAGGFVRRGLAGAVLMWASGISQIPAHYLALALSLASYVLLIYWLLKNTEKHFPVPLLLSCTIMGFPAYQYVLVRKDCLLVLLLIASLRLLLSSLSAPAKWTLVNVCSCAAILLHETFAFFAIPALALCTHERLKTRPVPRIMALIPSLACFGLTTWHHGSPQIAEAIHQSWMPLWKQACLSQTDYQHPFATIDSIGWSRTEGISLTSGLLEAGLYQPIAWTLVAAMSFVIVLVFVRGPSVERACQRLTGLLLFQLACISPLFLLGIDYGRWLFFCISSSVIMHSLEFKAPEPINSAFQRIPPQAFAWTHKFLKLIPHREIILLFFGIPILWSARNFITASPLGRLIDSIATLSQFK